MSNETITIADILGPWVEPQWASGLIERCEHCASEDCPILASLEQRAAI